MAYARYPRERVRAVIVEMIESGVTPNQLNPTQVRLRLGGGTWSIIHEEIAKLRKEQVGSAVSSASNLDHDLRDSLPHEVGPIAERLERALSGLKEEIRQLLKAVRAHDARRYEAEIAVLREELAGLRASPQPKTTVAYAPSGRGRQRR